MSKRPVCEHCGGETIDDCPVCGAPICCPKCCAETTEQYFHGVEVAPGAVAHASPDASPETLAALAEVARLVEKQYGKQPAPSDAEQETGGLTQGRE